MLHDQGILREYWLPGEVLSLGELSKCGSSSELPWKCQTFRYNLSLFQLPKVWRAKEEMSASKNLTFMPVISALCYTWSFPPHTIWQETRSLSAHSGLWGSGYGKENGVGWEGALLTEENTLFAINGTRLKVLADPEAPAVYIHHRIIQELQIFPMFCSLASTPSTLH